MFADSQGTKAQATPQPKDFYCDVVDCIDCTMLPTEL